MNQNNPFSKMFQQQPNLVRLAILQPAETSAPIKITLTDVKPEETSYECVSYDRTKDDDTIEIAVDDHVQAIPKNLETGLRAFRRKDRPRTLWADLLIGNNAEERSKQASIMRAILENSERTLCWTGEGNERSAKAFQIIREMGNRWTQALVQFNMPASLTRATPQQMQSVMTHLRSCPDDDLDSFNFGTWNEIYDVFGSPYWKSVQCLPEIVLAKKAIVVCGRNNIPWEDFHGTSKALAIFQGRFFGVPLLPKVMKNFSIIHGIEIAERRRRAGETIELLPMVMSARDADPKDPRECVFSMLPIVTPSKRLDFHTAEKPTLPEVDYSKTVQEVFIEASKYIIQERQDLMLWWSERAPCAKRIKGLPSWAPDYSVGNGGASALNPNNGLRQWWDSVEPRKRLRISDDNALHLQAFPLDKITYLSPPFHGGNAKRLALKEWQKLEQNPSEEKAEERKERFWRTLISNNGGYGQTMASFGKPQKEMGICFQSMLAEEEIFEKLNCTREQLALPEVNARIDRNDPRMAELFATAGRSEPYEEAMKLTTWGRRFFRTESGRFGMTGVENYSLVNSTYRNDEPEPQPEGAQPETRGMGELMSDPLARSMLKSFQRFLVDRDPNAADVAAKMMRGEFEFQTQPKIAGAEVGDIIVACIGGFHPYILRPVKTQQEEGEETSSAGSDSIYEYIGDSYLHGVMDGEPFKQTNWWLRTVYVTDMSKLVDITIV